MDIQEVFDAGTGGIAVPGRSQVAVFQPQSVKSDQAQGDAVIAFARRLKDWVLLARAVAQQIEDQQALVAWWQETVTVNHGGDRKIEFADRGLLLGGRRGTHRHHQAASLPLGEVPAISRPLPRGAVRRHLPQGDGRGGRAQPPCPVQRRERLVHSGAEHLHAARDVLGGIDLDPATSAAAQETIQATACFTEADDGLGRDWYGRVLINPPYDQPHIANFVSKMVEEYDAGRTRLAIMLTHNYTDTAWFHKAAPLPTRSASREAESSSPTPTVTSPRRRKARRSSTTATTSRRSLGFSALSGG